MQPIKITNRLPEILENKESDRVLILSHGKWEVAWLMDLEDGSPPMWCCDNEQSVDPDPTHWLPLPDQPNVDVEAPPSLKSYFAETEKRMGGCPLTPCSLRVFVRGAGVEGSRFEGFQSGCKTVSPLEHPHT